MLIFNKLCYGRISMKEYVLGIEATIEIFGGKWKTLIVYILMLGTKRTSELQRLIPKISQKVLIEQLRELEKDGIIQRISYEQMPPKVEYSLTEYGKTFSDIVTDIKMDKAKNMLNEPDARVYEVAVKLGYHDGRYFSQLFKRCTGMTPKEFQKRCDKYE